MLEQGMVQRRQGAGSVVVSTRPQARYVHTLSSLSDLFQFALVTTCDMVPGHRVIVGPSHRMALLLSSEPLSLTMVVGLPRSPSRRSSSRATRLPEIEVSKALAGAVVDHHQDAQIRQMIGTIRYGVSSLKPHTFSRAAAQIGLAHAIVIAQRRAVTARDDRSSLQHVTSARGLQRVARVLLDKEDARASGINRLDGAKNILHDQRGETE
jgi:hypothetical protein